jgi:hypothetical protein
MPEKWCNYHYQKLSTNHINAVPTFRFIRFAVGAFCQTNEFFFDSNQTKPISEHIMLNRFRTLQAVLKLFPLLMFACIPESRDNKVASEYFHLVCAGLLKINYRHPTAL